VAGGANVESLATNFSDLAPKRQRSVRGDELNRAFREPSLNNFLFDDAVEQVEHPTRRNGCQRPRISCYRTKIRSAFVLLLLSNAISGCPLVCGLIAAVTVYRPRICSRSRRCAAILRSSFAFCAHVEQTAQRVVGLGDDLGSAHVRVVRAWRLQFVQLAKPSTIASVPASRL
jgi:hypothetical protein